MRSLFGQSVSVVPPIQALRGLACRGTSLCLVSKAHWGALLAGLFSAVQCIRRLMGQPLYCSAAGAGVRGERGYGDGSTPYA